MADLECTGAEHPEANRADAVAQKLDQQIKVLETTKSLTKAQQKRLEELKDYKQLIASVH